MRLWYYQQELQKPNSIFDKGGGVIRTLFIGKSDGGDLVNHIKSLKEEVTVDATIKKLCNGITVFNLSQQPNDRKWEN